VYINFFGNAAALADQKECLSGQDSEFQQPAQPFKGQPVEQLKSLHPLIEHQIEQLQPVEIPPTEQQMEQLQHQGPLQPLEYRFTEQQLGAALEPFVLESTHHVYRALCDFGDLFKTVSADARTSDTG
jgi:hypothetical protein